MDIQTLYQQTLLFAAQKHSALNQTLPGTDLPYMVHLSNVAMEIFTAYQSAPNFNLGFALQLALLHDTIEDTDTTHAELLSLFGIEVAAGVAALTKDKTLPSSEQMMNSLSNIQQQPKEVWAVKIADRITNLQKPPKHWDLAKKVAYQQEAVQILHHLKGGNAYLEARLRTKIDQYEQYLSSITK